LCRPIGLFNGNNTCKTRMLFDIERDISSHRRTS
jgi:hypothetical protein